MSDEDNSLVCDTVLHQRLTKFLPISSGNGRIFDISNQTFKIFNWSFKISKNRRRVSKSAKLVSKYAKSAYEGLFFFVI